jgi:HEAT repeat protein
MFRQLTKISIIAVVAAMGGCTKRSATPTVAEIEAARSAAPQRKETTVFKPVLPEVGAVVDLPRSAAGSLAQIGPAAIPALKTALQDENPQVRRQAARALGKMGPDAEPAVPELTAAMNDTDAMVREAAAQALGKIGPAAAPAIPALIKAMEEGPQVEPASEADMSGAAS